jgi:alpha-tubulin suppressor-like RCC1 family protein
MNIARRIRRLAWQSGCTALAIGAACVMAGGTQGALADVGRRAAVTLPAPNAQAAGSWGYNPVGQLGIGTAEGYKNPAAVHPLYGQVVGLASGVMQVAAGNTHGLALRSDGTVWAWGQGTHGELGDGTLSSSTTPVQVYGLTGVVAVAAGIKDSLALRSDGTVWDWGENQFGQLGNGTTADSQPTPLQVRGLTGVTKIAAGGNFNLALRSDGTVWAWGQNQVGELGNGTTADSTVPRQVTGLSHVTRIAAGLDSSLAIRSAAYGQTTLWEWGGNFSNPTQTAQQVTGIDAFSIADISVGGSFALALGTDGSVWGWGDDTFGELGNGPHSGRVTRPVATFGPGSGIVQLSAGGQHALALKSNGTVLAFGFNDTGPLGDGDRVTPPGPVQVTGMTTAVQVSAGWQFSLAVYGSVVVTKGPGI